MRAARSEMGLPHEQAVDKEETEVGLGNGHASKQERSRALHTNQYYFLYQAKMFSLNCH